MHNDPVYETIQQKPEEVFTATALGDQQDRAKIMERNNQLQEQKRVHVPRKREYPLLEVDDTYMTMNSVGNLNICTSVSTGTK